MSKGTLLTGTVGGIIGAITVAIGVIWLFILGTLSTEIKYYVDILGSYLTSLLGTYTFGPGIPYSSPYPIPYFPSWSLFGLYSFMLAVFLVATSVLIGAGFYGTYKIGGRAASVIGSISSVVGITAAALLIMMVNLTTGYEQTYLAWGSGEAGIAIPFSPVPTPNFPLIWIGFVIIGVTFIVLGSVSISVRGMSEKPSAFYAAGILSIIAAVSFILGSLIGSIRVVGPFGFIVNYIGAGIFFVAVFGFVPIFVAFILWAVVFYSSSHTN